MSTIVIGLAALFAVMALVSFIPGGKEIASPLIKLLFSLLGKAGEHGMEWVVWLTKRLAAAHFTLLEHLLHTKATLDPTAELQEAREREMRKAKG